MADVTGQGAPTRARLLEIRHLLDEARAGHAMLERKREVLLREVWDLLREIGHLEREVRERFAAAYRALDEARLAIGSDGIAWVSLAPAASVSCAVEMRGVMGVALPLVRLALEPQPLAYSAFGTSVLVDRARQRWLAAGELLGTWSETYGSVWRAAGELARTQRRVNALEKLLIPEYEAAAHAIESALEEQEREGFLRGKRVKERREATHERTGEG